MAGEYRCARCGNAAFALILMDGENVCRNCAHGHPNIVLTGVLPDFGIEVLVELHDPDGLLAAREPITGTVAYRAPQYDGDTRTRWSPPHDLTEEK